MYMVGRPTEIPENDVYICESMFDEGRQQITELPKDGLKKLNQNKEPVHQDEIYFFRRLINPAKVGVLFVLRELSKEEDFSRVKFCVS